MKKVMLYALSTCGWCRKAKTFLEDNDVEFDHIYVDELRGVERDEVMKIIRKWNPKGSFPTIVVDDQDAVSGFKEAQLRELLDL